MWKNIKRYGFGDFKAYIRKTNNINKAGITSASLLILIMALSLLPFNSRTDSVEAADPLPEDAAISITQASNIVKLDLNLEAGDDDIFASTPSASELAFSITTDNITGYDLYVAITDDGKLYNKIGEETIDSLESINTITDAQTFASGNAQDYINKWGFKPNKYVSGNGVEDNTSLGNYLPSPTGMGTLIDTTNAANNTANEYTIGVGARVDRSKALGTYSNKLVLTAIPKPVSFIINYLDNEPGFPASGMPSQDSGATMSGVELSYNIPSKQNYSFVGWCDGEVSYPTENPRVPECSGRTYQRGEVYKFPNLSATIFNEVNLIAMWQKEAFEVMVSAPEGVASIAVNGTSYSISEGNVVFPAYPGIQNNIVPTFADGYNFGSWSSVTSPDTLEYNADGSAAFVSYGTTTELILSTENAPVISYMQDYTLSACQADTSSASTTLYDRRDDKDYQVRYINGGCWMVQNLRFTGAPDDPAGTMTLSSATTNVDTDKTITYITSNTSSTENAVINDNSTDGLSYNYVAASAGTITGSSNAAIAMNDICPAGWHMPTSSENSDIYSYVTEFNATTGNTWWRVESRDDNSARRYVMNVEKNTLNNKIVISSGHVSREDRVSIRCILGSLPSMDSVTDMQSLTREMVKYIAEGATATITDSRDGQDYTVAKIGDLIWMTRNLAIGCSGKGMEYGIGRNNITLSTYDTNIHKSTGSTIHMTLSTSDIGDLTAGNSYTTMRMACGSQYGAWYNYAAATAGQIAGGTSDSVSTAEPDIDLCPSGWRLPTYNELLGVNGQGPQKELFNPVSGGYWSGGNLTNSSVGSWWSKSVTEPSKRYTLDIDYSLYDGDPPLNPGSTNRQRGVYIRCVRSSDY